MAQLAMLATCVLAIYVGGRTLLIWRHTRHVQEFFIGTNVLALALGGLLLTAIGILEDPDREVALVPHLLGALGLAVHVVALYGGTWKIFRPKDRWALWLTAAATGTVLAWVTLAVAQVDPVTWRSQLYPGVRAVGMGWAAFECFRYSAMLRRRASIGLAEPAIAHRIWLWGMGAAASFAMCALDIASWQIVGTPAAAMPWGLATMACLGLLGAGCIALAFFPPRFYVRLAMPENSDA